MAADAAQQELAAADAELAASREQIGGWASQAYRGTGGLSELSGVAVLLDPRRTGDVSSTLATMDRVGGQYAEVVETAEQARARQQAAADRATAAVDAARTTADQALAAKAAADAAVQQQLVAYSAAQRTAAGLDPLAPDAAVVDRARAFLSSSQTCAGGILTGFPNGPCPSTRSARCTPRPTRSCGPTPRTRSRRCRRRSRRTSARRWPSPTPTVPWPSRSTSRPANPGSPPLRAPRGTASASRSTSVAGAGRGFRAAPVDGPQRGLFGFVNPAWAQGSPGPFEPWHWEFVAGLRTPPAPRRVATRPGVRRVRPLPPPPRDDLSADRAVLWIRTWWCPGTPCGATGPASSHSVGNLRPGTRCGVPSERPQFPGAGRENVREHPLDPAAQFVTIRERRVAGLVHRGGSRSRFAAPLRGKDH